MADGLALEAAEMKAAAAKATESAAAAEAAQFSDTNIGEPPDSKVRARLKSRHDERVDRLRENVAAAMACPRDDSENSGTVSSAFASSPRPALTDGVKLSLDGAKPPPPLARLVTDQDVDDAEGNGRTDESSDALHMELNTLLAKLPIWGVAEDSSVAGLFKAMHWQMLFPALDVVETALHPSLAIRPQASTWEVHARLLYPSAECHVVHTLWASATAVTLTEAPKLRFQIQVRARARAARCPLVLSSTCSRRDMLMAPTLESTARVEV